MSLPSPGDLPNPGIEPESPVSPALAGGFFMAKLLGKPEFIETEGRTMVAHGWGDITLQGHT